MVASVPELTRRTISIDGTADRLGELDFLRGGSAEAGADGESAFERGEDFRVPVSQQQRAPRADVIDVFAAIGIENVGAFAARDEGRVAADAAAGTDGRIDAARNELLGAREESFGSGAGRHRIYGFAPRRPGITRLKPRLMKIS